MRRNPASTELHGVGQKRWRKLCQELMILGIKKYLGWSWSLEGQDVSSGGEESPKGARVTVKSS